MKDKVLKYLAKGFWVFPLHCIERGQCTCGVQNCSNAGKHPRLKKGLKGASNDQEQIAQWFDDDAPRSNVGIVTGEISGITVIDIDVADGKMGAATWQELISEHGEPNTLMSKTGSGGMHVVFKYNSALKTSSNTLGDGVDVRNDGGYIVAPPSLHQCGGEYEWLNWHESIKTLPAYLTKSKGKQKRKKDTIYTSKYTLDQVEAMLEHVQADDRGMWRNVGIILGREFDRSEDAWKLYQAWSEKDGGKKGTGHDERMEECFYKISQDGAQKELSIATIVKEAIGGGWVPDGGAVPIEQFIYYGPGNNFIYRPTGSHWLANAVDAAVSTVNDGGKIVKASSWIKNNRLATSMTSEPLIDQDYMSGRDCHEGEIIESPGAAVFNRFRKATIELGDEKLATPFIEHVRRAFNKDGDADQFFDYMAHRVQKIGEKPRFALLIAGEQGVGKDTAIAMCIPAIGRWNVKETNPKDIESSYNSYASAALIRISEAANLQDTSKWAFNEQVKVLIAGSPDYVNINPKYGHQHSMRMYCGVVITTNHLNTGIYIPEDDRRYDVISCATPQEMGLSNIEDRKSYFEQLWGWFYDDRGKNHVAAFLNKRDLSKFSADGGQRRTDAHKSVVAISFSVDEWIEDILEEAGNPDAIRSDYIISKALQMGEKEQSVKRKMMHALKRSDYVQLKNNGSKSGRWKINGQVFRVYIKNGVNVSSVKIDQLLGGVF